MVNVFCYLVKCLHKASSGFFHGEDLLSWNPFGEVRFFNEFAVFGFKGFFEARNDLRSNGSVVVSRCLGQLLFEAGWHSKIDLQVILAHVGRIKQIAIDGIKAFCLNN